MSRPRRTSPAVERLLDECEAQGFPRVITDAAVLERVATIITPTKAKAA